MKPGILAEEVWQAQADVLRSNGYEPDPADRFGHGLGKNLTEPPSMKIGDQTILQENMTCTIGNKASLMQTVSFDENQVYSTILLGEEKFKSMRRMLTSLRLVVKCSIHEQLIRSSQS